MEASTWVNWGGVIITEPTTTFTNVMLSVLGFVFYYSIKQNNTGNIVAAYWSKFFLYFGIATGVGVIVHGMLHYLDENSFKFFKTMMNLINMVGILFSVRATLTFAGYNAKTTKKLFNIFNVLFILFSGLTIIVAFLKMPSTFNNFVFVTINAAISLVFIVYVHYVSYKNGSKLCGNILFGMGISFVTVYIHAAKISVNEWFNHKDIAHIIMMISIYFVYRGVVLKEKLLQD